MVFSEIRAGYCGKGLLIQDFTNDLKPKWFNGEFWIVNQNKVAVISPLSKLNSKEYGQLIVKKVNRYVNHRGNLYAEFTSKTEEEYYFQIVGSRKANTPDIVLTISDFERITDTVSEELDWINVDASSCEIHTLNISRILFFLFFVFLIILKFRNFKYKT